MVTRAKYGIVKSIDHLNLSVITDGSSMCLSLGFRDSLNMSLSLSLRLPWLIPLYLSFDAVLAQDWGSSESVKIIRSGDLRRELTPVGFRPDVSTAFLACRFWGCFMAAAPTASAPVTRGQLRPPRRSLASLAPHRRNQWMNNKLRVPGQMRPHLIMNKRWSLNSPMKKIMNLNPSLPIVVAATTSRSVPGQCRWRPEGRRDLIRQQHRQADAVAASVSSPPTTKMADDQALGQSHTFRLM
ncbi:hypothetical protein GUJ93_ZPchr0013g35788 [Zizania palustris]|uniref:Uncharacterized protein n=1 Tax=Zizania palustris TaxID=103762 RepID=A0A8J6C306_ZIZPA|nr:hypothetical protein GUJ93_ZPchr0013g35788 [Zizania palustris]